MSSEEEEEEESSGDFLIRRACPVEKWDLHFKGKVKQTAWRKKIMQDSGQTYFDF